MSHMLFKNGPNGGNKGISDLIFGSAAQIPGGSRKAKDIMPEFGLQTQAGEKIGALLPLIRKRRRSYADFHGSFLHMVIYS